jgi:hypothetical protein
MQRALNIFCHGRLPWEEEEGEEDGDEFEDNRRCTGFTPFGDHAKRRVLLETETLGGTTTATMIATEEEQARRRRESQDKDVEGAQHLSLWEVAMGKGGGGGVGGQV